MIDWIPRCRTCWYGRLTVLYFFLLVNSILNHVLFIHWLVDRHFGWFPSYNTAVNICVQVFGRRYVYIPVGYDIAKSFGNSFTFWGTVNLFSKVAAPFYNSSSTLWAFQFFSSSPTLVIVSFFKFDLFIVKFFCVSWYPGSWFPNKGLNPCPLQWKWGGGGGVPTTGPPGKSHIVRLSLFLIIATLADEKCCFVVLICTSLLTPWKKSYDQLR